MTSEKARPPRDTPDPAPRPGSPSEVAGRFRWQGDFISLEGAIEAVRAATEINAVDAQWSIGPNEVRPLSPSQYAADQSELLFMLQDEGTILSEWKGSELDSAFGSPKPGWREEILARRRASFEQEEKLITVQRHRAAELLFRHLGSRGCDEIRWLELQGGRFIPNPDLRRVGLGLLAQLADHWSTSQPTGEKRLMPVMFDLKMRQAMDIGVNIDELLAYFEANDIAYRLRPGAPLTSQSIPKLPPPDAEALDAASSSTEVAPLPESAASANGNTNNTAAPAEPATKARQLSPTYFHDLVCTLIDSGRIRAHHAKAIGAALDLCGAANEFTAAMVWGKLFTVAARPEFSGTVIRITANERGLEVPSLESGGWKRYTPKALELWLDKHKATLHEGL